MKNGRKYIITQTDEDEFDSKLVCLYFEPDGIGIIKHELYDFARELKN